MDTASTQILQHLSHLTDPETATVLQRFFKTGKGEYGEGDRFLGIRVPVLRKLVRQYQGIALEECDELLHSEYHEARLLAVLILVRMYDRGDEQTHQAVYHLYLDRTAYINNWDLVDSSAEHIVGRHLVERDRSVLVDLACSESLWERRIAIMSTFHFIKSGDFDETLKIAEVLVSDSHDLIHKATGWMLREIGKRDRSVAENFLQQHYQQMPRTMLRYAIEKYPEELRQDYLKGRV